MMALLRTTLCRVRGHDWAMDPRWLQDLPDPIGGHRFHVLLWYCRRCPEVYVRASHARVGELLDLDVSDPRGLG